LKLLPALASSLCWACMTPPRMCASAGECGVQASCVAGRCLAHGATPAIDTARRLLFAPVDTAYVRHDGQSWRGARAAVLGAPDGDAVLFLRFSASIPPEGNLLEAYLVLDRATEVDADPLPIALHAARVVDHWDSRSISWARQPRIEEVGAPVTRVFAAAGPLVRLDVRALVARWRRRARADFGIAVLADSGSPTGMAFALAPEAAEHQGGILTELAGAAVQSAQALSPFEPHLAAPGSVAEPRNERVGPWLELYIK
jgi:hypothetical protein